MRGEAIMLSLTSAAVVAAVAVLAQPRHANSAGILINRSYWDTRALLH